MAMGGIGLSVLRLDNGKFDCHMLFVVNDMEANKVRVYMFTLLMSEF